MFEYKSLRISSLIICFVTVTFGCTTIKEQEFGLFGTRGEHIYGIGFAFSPRQSFGEPEAFGIISDNKVKMYEYNFSYDSWLRIIELDLALPEGYTGVFSMGRLIGVIVDNTVHFYSYDDDTNSWFIESWLEMILPEGYTGVFSTGGNMGGVQVVLDNKVHFYSYEDNWVKISELEFVLPKRYKAVFGVGGLIGVIIGNKVHFYGYDFDNGSWFIPEIKKLFLPVLHTNVFSIGTGIGTINDNEDLYMDNFNWSKGRWLMDRVLRENLDALEWRRERQRDFDRSRETYFPGRSW